MALMSTRTVSRALRGAAEIQAARVDKAAPHTTHLPGWPHLDRRGNCLCDLGCCMGKAGCICKEGCTHQSHPR